MFRMVTALLLLSLIVESQAADKPRMAAGEHSLHATFDDNESHWNLFHDVDVRSTSEQLTLVVLKHLAKKEAKDEKAESKPAKGGFGDPLEDGSVKWPVRPSGQSPWLSPKRKLHGTVDAEGMIRFGFTATRAGKLVSLHFVGRSSFTGASGKVYLLSPDEPVLEGTWKLQNPYSHSRLVPGFNGASPFGR